MIENHYKSSVEHMQQLFLYLNRVDEERKPENKNLLKRKIVPEYVIKGRVDIIEFAFFLEKLGPLTRFLKEEFKERENKISEVLGKRRRLLSMLSAEVRKSISGDGEDNLIPIEEVSLRISLSVPFLTSLIKKGELVGQRIGKKLYVKKIELDNFMERTVVAAYRPPEPQNIQQKQPQQQFQSPQKQPQKQPQHPQQKQQPPQQPQQPPQKQPQKQKQHPQGNQQQQGGWQQHQNQNQHQQGQPQQRDNKQEQRKSKEQNRDAASGIKNDATEFRGNEAKKESRPPEPQQQAQKPVERQSSADSQNTTEISKSTEVVKPIENPRQSEPQEEAPKPAESRQIVEATPLAETRTDAEEKSPIEEKGNVQSQSLVQNVASENKKDEEQISSSVQLAGESKVQNVLPEAAQKPQALPEEPAKEAKPQAQPVETMPPAEGIQNEAERQKAIIDDIASSMIKKPEQKEKEKKPEAPKKESSFNVLDVAGKFGL